MRFRTITATALLALSGSLVAAGCSSNTATPSSSTSPTPTAPTAAASSSPSGGVALSAQDCQVIKPIANGAIASLAPMQTESSSAAASALGAFIAQLSQAQTQLTSPQAKADLGALVTALSKATTNSTEAQNSIISALQKLSTDCPS